MVDLIGRLSNLSSRQSNEAESELSPDEAPAVPPRRQPRQTQRRLTDDEIDDLVRRRWLGETIEALSTSFGIHRTTVMSHLRRQGVPGRPRSKRWNQRTLGLEGDNYRAGDSLADIASRYSISPSTVARRLQQAGVQLRPRPGRAAD